MRQVYFVAVAAAMAFLVFSLFFRFFMVFILLLKVYSFRREACNALRKHLPKIYSYDEMMKRIINLC